MKIKPYQYTVFNGYSKALSQLILDLMLTFHSVFKKLKTDLNISEFVYMERLKNKNVWFTNCSIDVIKFEIWAKLVEARV